MNENSDDRQLFDDEESSYDAYINDRVNELMDLIAEQEEAAQQERDEIRALLDGETFDEV